MGKRVGELSFHVSEDAWLVEPSWLETEFELFQSFVSNRSCLLPLPAKSLQDFSTKEPTYAQMVTAERFLMNDTKALELSPNEVDGSESIKESTTDLYAQNAALFWTGHSDRCTLPTWCACIHVSKDRVDYIGRWKPEESAAYNRTAETTIMEIQGEVATAIRDAGPTDVMREALTFAALTAFCTERKAVEEETDKMLHRIIKSRDLVCRAFGSHDDDEVVEIDPPEVPAIDLGPAGGIVRLSEGKRVVSET